MPLCHLKLRMVRLARASHGAVAGRARGARPGQCVSPDGPVGSIWSPRRCHEPTLPKASSRQPPVGCRECPRSSSGTAPSIGRSCCTPLLDARGLGQLAQCLGELLCQIAPAIRSRIDCVMLTRPLMLLTSRSTRYTTCARTQSQLCHSKSPWLL